MSWWAEVVVKLHELDGQGNRAVVETDSSGALLRGGQPFTALDSLLGGNRTLRQSFPKTSRRLESKGLLGPNVFMRSGLDTFLRIRIHSAETVAALETLIDDLRNVSEVQSARQSPRIVLPQADFEQEQKYLDPSCVDASVAEGECAGGIDARYAWTVPGGDGSGVRVCLVETAFSADSSLQPVHADLPSLTVPATPAASADAFDRAHGTMSLGVLGARNDVDADGLPVGTTGICHGASELLFSTTLDESAPDAGEDTAIDRVTGGSDPLGPGDVLILNFTFDTSSAGYSGGPAKGPPETSPPVRVAIQAAAAMGITVVQAAGNELEELVRVVDDLGDLVWEPDEASSDYDDSLGIVVGAGVPGTSADRHSIRASLVSGRWSGSNYGTRVDCQGWGDSVATTASDIDGLVAYGYTYLDENDDQSYVADYRDTSAATPMIGALVACLQGAAKAETTVGAKDPWDVRALLRDPANGSPQRAREYFAVEDYPIGPLPDLFKLLQAIGIAPDLYCRDTLADTGARGAGFTRKTRSPDLILRSSPSSDPEADFGAAHWAEDDFIQQAVPGTDAQIYVRAGNRGNAPDSATVRVYWTEPAPYVHPRDYRLLGEAALEPVDGGGVGVTGKISWVGSGIPDPAHYGLVAEIRTDHGPAAFPRRYSPGVMPFVFAGRRNEIAVRNVQRERIVAGGSARFSLNLRGVPGVTVPRFVYRFSPDLPPGATVVVRTSHPVYVVGSSGAAVRVLSPSTPTTITSPGPYALGPVVLGPSARIELTMDVTVPSSIRPRTYTSFVDQIRSGDVYGRITFILDAK